MKRPAFWILVAVTAAVVGVGIWYFLRDEYPFQVDQGDVSSFAYSSDPAGGGAYGVVNDPPAEMAGWISAMERDTSNEPISPTATVTILLRDGRSLRLDLAGERGYGTWLRGATELGASAAVHLTDAFAWYLAGVGDGLHGPGTAGSPSPGSPVPTPSTTPLLSTSPSSTP